MAVPQAILDQLNKVQGVKDTVDADTANKTNADQAVAAAQQVQATAVSTLTADSQSLGDELNKLEAIIAAYFKPGGTPPGP